MPQLIQNLLQDHEQTQQNFQQYRRGRHLGDACVSANRYRRRGHRRKKLDVKQPRLKRYLNPPQLGQQWETPDPEQPEAVQQSKPEEQPRDGRQYERLHPDSA